MRDDAYAVFWTTTRGPVPTNFAIVVGGDIDYVEVPARPKASSLARSSTSARICCRTMKELGENYEVVRDLKGLQSWKAAATTRSSCTLG